MPELPEVETIVRLLRPLLARRTVRSFQSYWERQVVPSVAAIRRAIVGTTIRDIMRRGKWIVLVLRRAGEADGYLLIHLRMSGRLALECAGSREARSLRAEWMLDSGRRLLFCDARKFGRIEYLSDLGQLEARLGPDPLDPGFTNAAFARILRSRSRRLKPLLLDQSVIAGLGNIYVDESLFRAGLHPLARSDRLGRAQIQRLCRAIRTVLREAIRYNGTSFDWVYSAGRMQDRLRVYGRRGRPCRRCRTPIAFLRVAGRGTYICPKCQEVPPAIRPAKTALRHPALAKVSRRSRIGELRRRLA